jgi:hypothetical protein
MLTTGSNAYSCHLAKVLELSPVTRHRSSGTMSGHRGPCISPIIVGWTDVVKIISCWVQQNPHWQLSVHTTQTCPTCDWSIPCRAQDRCSCFSIHVQDQRDFGHSVLAVNVDDAFGRFITVTANYSRTSWRSLQTTVGNVQAFPESEFRQHDSVDTARQSPRGPHADALRCPEAGHSQPDVVRP